MKARNAAVLLGLSVLFGVIAAGGIVTMRQASAAARSARAMEAPWTAPLSAIDAALARGDVSRALMLWHPAHVAVLYDRRWEGLIEVGDAILRIESAAGFPKAGESKARELYLMALFRARRDGSVQGVLRTAAAFNALGDRGGAGHAMQIAATLGDQRRTANTTPAPSF
jgi:hypothetical protein